MSRTGRHSVSDGGNMRRKDLDSTLQSRDWNGYSQFQGGLCRKVPKRPHSGRRFGWGMGNIRRIWTRLMPSRKLFPGALCAMPVSS